MNKLEPCSEQIVFHLKPSTRNAIEHAADGFTAVGPMTAFAVVDDLQSLMVAIRPRVDELGITLETVEDTGGLFFLGRIPLRQRHPP